MADRPYVVELASRENSQRRRLNITASDPDEAATYAEALEAEYVAYRLDEQATLDRYPLFIDSDTLAESESYAQHFPADGDVYGRFIRAGKVLSSPKVSTAEEKRLARGARARLSLHHQEKPYEVVAVGDTGLVMAVTGALYGVTALAMISGSSPIVWASDTIKTTLHTGYTLDQDAHDFYNDVSGTEVTGTGYTAGGVTLASKTGTYDTASDQVRLDAADVSWTTSTISATDAIVWKDAAGASTTDQLIAAFDFGATVATTAGTFQITWDATGIINYDIT